MKNKVLTVLLFVAVAALSAGLIISLVHMKKQGDEIADFKDEALTVRDVGIGYINHETVVRTKYYSYDQNNEYEEIDIDLEKVKEILKSLDGAVFYRADEPDGFTGFDNITVETEEDMGIYRHKYIIGIESNNIVRVSIDGEISYYKCSAIDAFRAALSKAQDR